MVTGDKYKRSLRDQRSLEKRNLKRFKTRTSTLVPQGTRAGDINNSPSVSCLVKDNILLLTLKDMFA